MIERSKKIMTTIWSNPAHFFLATAGIIGILMVFILPPFQAPDEHTHFYKAVQLAYGKISAEKFSDRDVGSLLPQKYQDTVNNFKYLWVEPVATDRVSPGFIINQILHGPSEEKLIITRYENTAVYPSITYLPQAIGVFIAKFFTESVILQLYAARLFVLASWLILVFYAIRLIPFAKWAIVALSVTPVTLMLSASSSNDAISFGVISLFIAFFSNLLMSKRRLSRNALFVMFGFAIILGSLKLPYLMVLFLVFLLPSRLFVGKTQGYLYKVSIILTAIISALLWMWFSRKLYIPTNPNADTVAQINFILHHPMRVAATFFDTYILSLNADIIIEQFYNLQSWLAVRIPLIFGIIGYISLFLSLVISRPGEKNPSLSSKQRLAIILGYLVGSLSVMGLIYLTFNPVGSNEVIGLNSRYYIPFTYLLIFALYGLIAVRNLHEYEKVLIFIRLCLLSISVSTIIFVCVRYFAEYS